MYVIVTDTLRVYWDINIGTEADGEFRSQAAVFHDKRITSKNS